MNLTNRHNLPDAFVNAVRNDPYDSSMGDISVTKLIDAPHKRKLYLENKKSIVEDVSDRVWSLLGQAVHHILERGQEGSHVLREQRLVSEYGGMKVTGQFDTFDTKTGVLSDYKVTSVYKVMNGGGEGNLDWTRQLNVLSQLLRDEFWDVNKIQIVAVLRDWSSTEAARNPMYPQTMVQVIPLMLWSPKDTQDYIVERVKLHEMVLSGEEIPCSEEERWAEPTTWALMKEGGKRAVKIFRNVMEVPLEFAPKHYLEERKGGYRRCEKWCEVNQYCKYYVEEKNE